MKAMKATVAIATILVSTATLNPIRGQSEPETAETLAKKAAAVDATDVTDAIVYARFRLSYPSDVIPKPPQKVTEAARKLFDQTFAPGENGITYQRLRTATQANREIVEKLEAAEGFKKKPSPELQARREVASAYQTAIIRSGSIMRENEKAQMIGKLFDAVVEYDAALRNARRVLAESDPKGKPDCIQK